MYGHIVIAFGSASIILREATALQNSNCSPFTYTCLVAPRSLPVRSSISAILLVWLILMPLPSIATSIASRTYWNSPSVLKTFAKSSVAHEENGRLASAQSVRNRFMSVSIFVFLNFGPRPRERQASFATLAAWLSDPRQHNSRQTAASG